MRAWVWAAGTSMLIATACRAQNASPARPIGTVSAAEANVTSGAGAPPLRMTNGRDLLVGSATVAARDHTAHIDLERGGRVMVCMGTAVHLAESGDDALLVGLDRGAMEIETAARTGDVVVTPDMRFTMTEDAPLDLAMRVTPAGDTCVDNRGRRAPTLRISDLFGEATYLLKPGQHVTFEHGSLREVVDKETVPCGCPPDELERGSLADAALAGGATGKPMTPAEKSAVEHPFPAAVSDGLVPPSPATPEAPNATHVQVAATLAYDPNAPAQAAAAAAAATPPTQPPPRKQTGGPFAAIGRFFKRLFAR